MILTKDMIFTVLLFFGIGKYSELNDPKYYEMMDANSILAYEDYMNDGEYWVVFNLSNYEIKTEINLLFKIFKNSIMHYFKFVRNLAICFIDIIYTIICSKIHLKKKSYQQGIFFYFISMLKPIL